MRRLLASILVTETIEDESAVNQAAEEAAAGVMTLGYGSKTALTLLETTDKWRQFERGSYPRRRARDETLEVLDGMLERSLPPDLRPKGLAAEWSLRSGVHRPD